jgi:uncharacterized membrane protein
MWWMTRRHLARLVDCDRIAGAVAACEAGTSGEIAVSISPYFWGSVESAAARAFARLGVGRTPERNGVLLFVVPSRRRFVVRGDEGAHARLGQGFWDETVAVLAADLRAGVDLTSAIVRGVERIGAGLARHFPPTGPRANRLADTPEIGRK